MSTTDKEWSSAVCETFARHEETAVLLLGDGGAGKRTIKLLLERSIDLIVQFVNDKNGVCLIPDAKKLMNVSVIEPGSLPAANYARKVVLLYVYDVCSEESLSNLVTLNNTVLEKNPSLRSSTRCLVGNKIDLEYWRRVSVGAGLEAAAAIFASFVEMSAHSGQHVDYVLDVVLKCCFSRLMDCSLVTKLLKVISSAEDDKLTEIARMVENIKREGEQMSQELETQNKLLDYIDENVEGAAKSTGAWSGLKAPKEQEKIWKKKARDTALSSPRPRPAPVLAPSTAAPEPLPSAGPALSLSQLELNMKRTADAPAVIAGRQRRYLGDVEKVEKGLGDIELSPAEDLGWGHDADDGSVLQADEDESDGDFEEEDFPPLPVAGAVDLSPVLTRFKNLAGQSEGAVAKPAAPYRDRRARAEKGDKIIERIQGDVDDIKAVMNESINSALDRAERLEDLIDKSGDLQMEAASFHRKAKSLKRRMYCSNCLRCMVGCVCGCPVATGQYIYEKIKCVFSKKALFDNVLADTENAFQTLAKSLAYLQDAGSREWSVLRNLLFGYWVRISCSVTSVVLVLSSAVTLILPSFFTLLIVRTGTVEKESKAFGIRQEVIRVEKKEESLVRWVRIILRSLPMTFYLLVLPTILVYFVFPVASERVLTICLVSYLSGVILLQVLGSARSYYSWKVRDVKLPTPPTMYVRITDTGEIGQKPCCYLGCFSCCMRKNNGQSNTRMEKTVPPKPPNTFDFKKPANWIELFSLTLEFVQMASFALQRNPYTSTGDDADAPTMAPTALSSIGVDTASASDDDEVKFWGISLFEAAYVNFPFDSTMQLILMWGSICLVGILLLIFSSQFLSELRRYGQLMKRVEDKDVAKDSFFYSFTGAIVYGHGTPRNISNRLRLLVGLLSDGLFLVISVQLLQVFACDYEDIDRPTLFVDDTMICWEGHHAVLAIAALVAYAFYVPLSIMITPMLLEAPRKEENTGGNVTYLKLYLMSINVVKSIMLLVAVLGPQGISTAVVSSIVASFCLGSLTYTWFQSQDLLQAHYCAEFHPCNIPFVNYWKAASYSAAVLSAVILMIAHALQESSFAPQYLTTALVLAWTVVVLIFATLFYRYNTRYSKRRTLISDLIQYPFYIRDLKEGKCESFGLSPPPAPSIFEENAIFIQNKYQIPGFNVSPWADQKNSLESSDLCPKDYDGRSLSGILLRAKIIKL